MSVQKQIESLRVNSQRLQAMRSAFAQRIAAGLSRDGEQIRALRAYLSPPSRQPVDGASRVAVIDVGGTNCRGAVLSWTATGFELVAEPVARALPVRQSAPLDAQAFFDFQAELLQITGAATAGMPLGYCFSYPAEVLPDHDARLIRWTKGIDVLGVEGQRVGQGLCQALERLDLKPSGVVVLNDTVAALLGGAVAHEGDPRMAIGLIAGTGTNMAGFFDASTAPKLAGHPLPMALNLESGNFSPPSDFLTDADRQVDQQDNPGGQRFEKAASGHYLPYIFEQMMPGLPGFDPQLGTQQLTKLASDDTAQPEASALARALLDRSADMVAAGLAALLDHYPAGTVGILAEGGLFWQAPGYADRCQRTLEGLVGSERFQILRQQQVNLVGAACAACHT